MVFKSSVLMLSSVSLRPLLTELLSSQLSASTVTSWTPLWMTSLEVAVSGARFRLLVYRLSPPSVMYPLLRSSVLRLFPRISPSLM